MGNRDGYGYGDGEEWTVHGDAAEWAVTPENRATAPRTGRIAALFPRILAVSVLSVLLTAFSGCGRQGGADGTGFPTPEQTETVNPTPTLTPSESVTPTPTPSPDVTATPDASEATGEGRPFAANDFKVPEGSAVTQDQWLVFIRKSLLEKMSSYSGSQGFIEAYGFTSAVGGGSGEHQLSCNVETAWFSPGSRAEDFDTSRETFGVAMTVLEQSGTLKLLTYESDYTESGAPAASEKALRDMFTAWAGEWQENSGKTPAAVPTVTDPVLATPIGGLTGDFLPPAQGETMADLDGDGTKETIRVVFREDDAKWEIHVGDTMISDWYESPAGAYLVDLDKGDGQVEVAVADHGPSDDALTSLYRYRNGVLEPVGSVSGILFASDGKGHVSTYASSYRGPMLTWFFRIEYALNSTGRLAMIPTRWYTAKVSLTAKRDLPLYAEADSKKAGAVLKAGTPVVMDLSDVVNWFHVKAADGTEGWLWYQDGENLMLPDGGLVPQQDALDGIYSAG